MASAPRGTDIVSVFKTIDNQIKALNRTINNAKRDSQELEKALKIEPANVDLAKERYDRLGEAIAAANEKITLNKQKQDELNKTYTDKSSDTYKNKLAQLNDEAHKFTTQLKSLEVQQRAAQKAIDDANKAMYEQTHAAEIAAKAEEEQKKAVEEAAKAEAKHQKELKRSATATEIYTQATKAVKLAVVAFVSSLTALTKNMAELGKELISNANKYDTTVYKLQEQSYLFRTLTGNADAYTQSLQALNSVLAQILSGRGQSQLESLKQIGLSKSDVTGKTTAEAYETIFNALRDVGDQATASAVAVKLFGDAGAYVAEMAYADQEQFEKYREQFRQVGGVSEESAQKLAELSNQLELLKYSAQATGADIIVSLAPAITSILSLVLKLAKAVGNLYDVFGEFGGTVIVLAGLITLKLIPAIIKVIIQHAFETAAIKAKTAATLTYISVATLGIGAILGIAGAVASSTKATDDATSSMEDYTAALQQANDTVKKFNNVSEQMSKDLSVSSEAVSTYNSSYNAKIELTIKGEGDTAVSGETAKKVSEVAADYVNKAFGGIIS